MVASWPARGTREGLARLIDELSPTTRRRARCTAATARTSRRRAGRPRCASRARRSPSPTGDAAGLATRPTTAWSSWTDGETVVRRIGSGQRGRADGAGRRGAVRRAAAGCACCRRRWPSAVGYDVVVADTVNHLLRGVELDDRRGHHGRRHRPAVARHGRRRRPRRARRRPVLAVGRGLVRRQGHRRDGRHPPAVVVRPGEADRPACTPAPPWRRCATARWTRCGWPSRPACPCRPTAATLWIADSRDRPRCATSRDGRMHTAVGSGPVRLRPRGRPGRPGAAPASAGRVRAARRLGAGRGHLQRRGAAVRPGDRRGVHRGHRAGRAERHRRCCPDGGVVVVESAAHRLTRLAPGRWSRRQTSPGARHRTERPPDRARARRGDAGRHLHPGARARSWTSRSARRPGCEVSASPPELLVDGAGVTHRPAPPAGDRLRRRRRRAAGGRPGGHLRRRRRARGLPPHPAGLGRADRGAPGRRRPPAADPARPRRH